MIVLMLLAFADIRHWDGVQQVALLALYSFYFKQTPSDNTRGDTEQTCLNQGAKYSAEFQFLLFHRNPAALTAPAETPESEGAMNKGSEVSPVWMGFLAKCRPDDICIYINIKPSVGVMTLFSSENPRWDDSLGFLLSFMLC